MSANHLILLDRAAYLRSIKMIQDAKSIAFAEQSLRWWDKHFNWKIDPCLVLADAQGHHLCYLFFKIDRYHHYLTIHNIFTPLADRHRGYAHELLDGIMDQALLDNVRRVKFSSISTSLDFYLSLGFIYWGITSAGDFYCDLPLPDDGLKGLKLMIKTSDNRALIGASKEVIYKKVFNQADKLSDLKHLLFEKDKSKMQSHYRYKNMLDLYESID